MKKTIVVFGSLAGSLINFRYSLLQALVNSGYNVIASAPDADEEIVRKLNAIKVEYRNIPLCRTGMNPIRDILNLLRIQKIFKDIKPDILLSYTIKPVIYGSIAAYFAGVKNIYSMITGLGYSFTSKGLKSRIVNGIVRLLLKLSLTTNELVFFQNPDDMSIFIEKNYSETRSKLI